MSDRLCVICGNEIDEAASTCPFCGAQQPGGRRGGKARVRTVNLERGMPTVPQALRLLDAEVASARVTGVRVLRLIHGYGSTGEGGRIRAAVHQRLADLRARGLLRGYVKGEQWSDADDVARRLLDAFPTLRASLRTDSGNAGVTIAEV